MYRTVRLVFCDGPMIGTTKLEDEDVILSRGLYRMYLPEQMKAFQFEELKTQGSVRLNCRVAEYRPMRLPIDTSYPTYAMVMQP